jgi:hypothetical protein
MLAYEDNINVINYTRYSPSNRRSVNDDPERTGEGVAYSSVPPRYTLERTMNSTSTSAQSSSQLRISPGTSQIIYYLWPLGSCGWFKCAVGFREKYTNRFLLDKTCGKTAGGRDGREESPTYEIPCQSLIELIRLVFRSVKCHVHSRSDTYVSYIHDLYSYTV